MTPHYSDDWLTVYGGDCRAVLAELPADSVHAVITSPPYWSLRDYGSPPVAWGGKPGCEHVWGDPIPVPTEANNGTARWQHGENGEGLTYEVPDDYRSKAGITQGQFCSGCGAWLGQLGLEPDHLLYVAHIVEVMAEVRRVLRPDGVLWLNLGDTYAAKGRGSDAGWDKSRLRNPGRIQKAQAAALRRGERHRGKAGGLKEKDRAMIPARVAIALQDDGWWLRDEVVWSKPNPMPSSTEDRTTPAHEMVFMLTKRPRYHYDAAAIAEPAASADEAKWDPGTNGLGGDDRRTGRSTRRFKVPAGWNSGPTENDIVGRYWPGIGVTAAARRDKAGNRGHRGDNRDGIVASLTRNKRSVWEIPTQPFPSAHFATFPERLVEPMILATVPEQCCANCGRPFRRVVVATGHTNGRKAARVPDPGSATQTSSTGWHPTAVATDELEPACDCAAGWHPGVVLDPFGGSGTVGLVAQRFRRVALLVDLNPEYLRIALSRASAKWGVGGPILEDDGTAKVPDPVEVRPGAWQDPVWSGE